MRKWKKFINTELIKMSRDDGMALAMKLGKRIWKVRWIDLNQGDENDPRYRSRSVCCELKNGI